MAHQMSPPQRPLQRPYSPFDQQPAHSPPGIALPPAKRPRLSPGISPGSLPGTPSSHPHMSIFNDMPYALAPAPSQLSTPSFNTPQPPAVSPSLQGTMGPPPRPTPEQKAAKEKEEKEKVTDISDISDAMWGSGVDLREEENYLSSTSRTFYGTSSFSQSFDSQNTSGSTNSFNLLTQGLNGSQLSGSGPASQSAASQEAIEAELERKHRDAALKYAKEHEQHLRDPFLLGNSLRHRMHKVALNQGVHLEVKGLYDPPRPQPSVPQKPQGVNGVVAVGADDTALASIKAKSIPEIQHALLDEGAKLADILSLVSLAANERLRGLLDEAFAISRSRRYGSHGAVPPDLQDIAMGEGRKSTSVKPESITLSQWDLPQSREGATLGAPATPEPSVSFTSSLPTHLSSLATSEHTAELARIKRRADRAARTANPPTTDGVPDATNASLAPGTPAHPATPTSADATTPADAAAPSADLKPLTKKERERMAKAGQSDEVLHKNANSTAAMQLGFGRKFSWMTGGGGAGAKKASNPFAKKSGSKLKKELSEDGAGSGGGGTREGGSSAEGKRDRDRTKGARKGLGHERKFGVWREDGEQGKDIQVRDLAAVLDRDGKHRRTLEKTWVGLGREA